MNRYPEYRESGIDWAGSIPADWSTARIKTHADLLNGFPFPSDNFNPTKGMPLVRIRDITAGTTETRFSGDYDPRYLVEDGDVLIGMDGDFLVRWWEGGTALLNQRCCCVRPHNTLDRRFLYYLLGYPLEVINDLTYYTTVKHLSSADVLNIAFPFPPLSEQRSIADYLDRKTAQIDTLIRKKQALIGLLREQRTALINRAVTNGLDPDVPMKDSGIQWLGDVPEHWDLVRLKHLGSIRYGLGQPPRESSSGVPFIRATNVYRGDISVRDLRLVDPADVPAARDAVLQPDDILVVRSGAYTGDSAIIPEQYEGAIAGYDMVMRITEARPQFVAYGLLSPVLLQHQIFPMRMRAAQPHLNREELGEVLVPLPPPDEQDEIIGYVTRLRQGINGIIYREQKIIGLLRELRTSLISEVVTGKIDVRNSGVAAEEGPDEDIAA